jgi:AcrR family transcriptional regulator
MDRALLELLEQKDFEYITIKEICALAGVNRSTFYLHYENTRDLLTEATEQMLLDFQEYFPREQKAVIFDMAERSLEDLLFITPEYLMPYLTYIRENKRVIRTAMKHMATMGLERIFDRMFRHVFDPILARFDAPEEQRGFMMIFYLSGINAIITKWVEHNCEEPMEQIMEIIMKCVDPGEMKKDTP